MSNQTTLQMIFDKQEGFQTKFGYDRDMSMEARSALIHTHAAFAIEEIYEMLRELPFHKPWKDYSEWDRIKMIQQISNARKEYIDVLIFVANMGVFLGFDEAQIREEYLEKLGINIERQENPELGYISEKSES
ncbi:MAG TPA: hypothetical protein VK190_04675 [Pseudoneobacillus sp.]|nr:hypothetical protein [Pseudoneobacillus sp.]